MMATAARLALRQLRRDIRLSEYVVVFCALVLAVGALTSVGFFANRVERAIAAQASTLLAADLTVRGGEPIDTSVRIEAERRNLRVAQIVEFPSVVLNPQGDTALVSVKAIGNGYPLRGELTLSSELFGAAAARSQPPDAGKIWIDSRLPGTIPIGIGDVISLGELEFVAESFISYEPDRSGDVFQMAPRVMMSLTDLPGSGLLGEGSRAMYRMLFAGVEQDVAEFADWLRSSESADYKIQTVEDGRPAVRSALVNARRFLGMAAALAVLLAGAAVALAARQIAERDMDSSSLLRTFGAKRALVLQIVFIRLLVLALLAGLVGSALGYVAQFGLSAMLARWFSTELPSPSLLPLVGGFGCSIVAMAGFCLPPLFKAVDTPVVRVLRRDMNAEVVAPWVLLICGLLAPTLLLFWLTRDLFMSVVLMAGVVAVFLILLLVSRGLVSLAARVKSPSSRQLLAGIRRRPQSVTLQIAAFGVGLLALLLLAIVRADVLATWQRQVPPDAPNFFLINIQPDEVDQVRDFFTQRDINVRALYPLVRARLHSINDKRIGEQSYGDQFQSRMARREFNLSFRAEIDNDNELIAGEWWDAGTEESLFSLEREFASEIGVKIGDELHFRIADEVISGTVSSLRNVEWESFNPNFFVVASPPALASSPKSYITSVRVEDDRGSFVRDLVSSFPSVTALEVGSILKRVTGIMNRAAAAVQYVFLFTLFAGVLVLVAAVLASRRERFREAAILRTLGASRVWLRRSLSLEFLMIGLLAGVLAATIATVVGWILVEQVMQLTYHFNPWLWLVGVVLGVAGIWTAGMLATRPVLRQSPVAVLRNQV